MLANRGTEAVRLTRREAGRLAVAAIGLIVAMTVILGADFSPQNTNVQVGDLVPGDIAAPRALTYESQALTAAARSLAADAVPPLYDFTSERAITIAAAQSQAFSRAVRLLDTAFDTATTELARCQLTSIGSTSVWCSPTTMLLAVTEPPSISGVSGRDRRS